MSRFFALLVPPALLLASWRTVRPVASFSTLITFDVDGTLVSSSPGWEKGAHGRSFVHAVDTILGGGSERPTDAKAVTIPDLLEKREFAGSTDGLILLRLARKMLGPSHDEAAASSRRRGVAPLPGVLDTLETLASEHAGDGGVACGLVTGNVEGIARRKMRALGVHGTGALASLPAPQGGRTWEGVEELRFLGGFGSDYCSGRLDDPDRNFLDRGEQLAICVERCEALAGGRGASTAEAHSALERVIHVGDAPADVLAAKSYVDHPAKPPGLCVGVVGVATGSYSAEELASLCGERIPGVWEPVVLEQGQGVGDEQAFLGACGLV
ncbi:hypothetical protein ACHAWF_003213 [Thalassiosira exigua]